MEIEKKSFGRRSLSAIFPEGPTGLFLHGMQLLLLRRARLLRKLIGVSFANELVF